MKARASKHCCIVINGINHMVRLRQVSCHSSMLFLLSHTKIANSYKTKQKGRFHLFAKKCDQCISFYMQYFNHLIFQVQHCLHPCLLAVLFPAIATNLCASLPQTVDKWNSMTPTGGIFIANPSPCSYLQMIKTKHTKKMCHSATSGQKHQINLTTRLTVLCV